MSSSGTSTPRVAKSSAADDAGIDAATFVADATDPAGLRTAVESVRAHFGRIDVGYFGPAASMPAVDIAGLDSDGARDALSWVVAGVDFGALLLPEFRRRGSGGLLFAGGLSSVVPMPPLGGLALMTAALRNYALTLHAALAPEGIYAGTVTIGGLIGRSDVERVMLADADRFGALAAKRLDPDALADTVWRLFSEQTAGEAVVTP
jgi:NAD(P)-dependent dehydrogenase (short-subunit alcohol dehydrogenase family)